MALNDNVFLHVVAMLNRTRRTALGYPPARCKALRLPPTFVNDINPARINAVMRAKQLAWEKRQSFTYNGVGSLTTTRIFDASNNLLTMIHCFAARYCSTFTMITRTNCEITPDTGNGNNNLLRVRAMQDADGNLKRGEQSIVVYKFDDNRIIQDGKWRDDYTRGDTCAVPVQLIVQ